MAKRNAYEVLHHCRMCGSGELTRVLDLGETPLANDFRESKSQAHSQPRYPLVVNACEECNHAQLSIAVDPEVLFRNYLYEAGPNMGPHFAELAATLIEKLKLEPESPYTPGDLVVEFGSNDGSLLEHFSRAGIRCVGVEPGRQLAQLANARYSFPTVNDFFTLAVAGRIRNKHGPARLVVANNVMAHLREWDDTVLAVDRVLAYQGDFVFEVQDREALQRDCLFDMIYHEHLDYHDGGEALTKGTFGHKFFVSEVGDATTHGGSLCVRAVKQAAISAQPKVVYGEQLNNCIPWFELSRRIATLASQLKEVLARELTPSPLAPTFVGYGAPAKFTTMAHALNLPEMTFVVDDSKLKQGRFTPGRGEPIVPTSKLVEACAKGPVVCFVSAWNFADRIVEKVREQCRAAEVGPDGKVGPRVFPPTFVVPLPTIRVIPST